MRAAGVKNRSKEAGVEWLQPTWQASRAAPHRRARGPPRLVGLKAALLTPRNAFGRFLPHGDVLIGAASGEMTVEWFSADNRAPGTSFNPGRPASCGSSAADSFVRAWGLHAGGHVNPKFLARGLTDGRYGLLVFSEVQHTREALIHRVELGARTDFGVGIR